MTTITDLAATAAKTHHINHNAAHDAATTYLKQISQIDQTNHHPDNLPDDVAEFPLESITHARCAGDI